MSDLVGQTLLDRYHILAKLGKGGMGQVYLARDRARGCPVAIKVLIPPSAGNEVKYTERFQREAESLVRLGHPHIVRLYEFVQEADPPFLVIDYVEGQSLQQLLAARQGKPLSPAEAMRILYQIGGALHFAHQHRVYHRDIKPGNILIDRSGKAYLTDFGLALLTDRSRLSSTEPVIGTPDYAAPEQLMGEPVDARTDVYALGVLLYELLTGQLPFAAEGPIAPIGKILNEPPELPRQWNPEIPFEVESIILKALSKSKDDRYPNVATMLYDLQATEGENPSPLISLPETPAEIWGQGTGVPQSEQPATASTETLLGSDRAFRRRRLPAQALRHLLFLCMGIAVLTVATIGLARLFESRPSQEGFVASPTPSHTSPPPLPSATATATVVPAPTATPIPSPSPSSTVTPTPTATDTPIPTPTPTIPPTITPSPTPYCVVSTEQLTVYSGPGENYGVQGEIRRGDQLPLWGRSGDGAWLQVDFLGREGWVHTQSVETDVDLLVLSLAQAPSTPSHTPTPVGEATSSAPGPNTTLSLQNPGFENIQQDHIPGWRWWAMDNVTPGEKHDANTSFDTPLIKQADDPVRAITGSTLQIDAAAYLKFRVHVFQTVSVDHTVPLRFQVLASAYTDVDTVKLGAGIDPEGGHDCSRAQWGTQVKIDQSHGTVQLVSPDVVVGRSGRVTVCMYAETLYPARSNAAFFDDARLIANPE